VGRSVRFQKLRTDRAPRSGEGVEGSGCEGGVAGREPTTGRVGGFVLRDAAGRGGATTFLADGSLFRRFGGRARVGLRGRERKRTNDWRMNGVARTRMVGL
jgi:hypothetical protein